MKKYKYLKSGFDYSLNVAVPIELKNPAFEKARLFKNKDPQEEMLLMLKIKFII